MKAQFAGTSSSAPPVKSSNKNAAKVPNEALLQNANIPQDPTVIEKLISEQVIALFQTIQILFNLSGDVLQLASAPTGMHKAII